MNRRQLGKTGIEVSEIAFGGVEIGMPYGIGNTHMPTEEEAIQLLQSALAAGINFYDTARYYGKSEELMGKAFAGKREEVVIATKTLHLHGVTNVEEVVLKALAESLAALQTSYTDIYMLHDSDPAIFQRKDIIHVFQKLKSEGAIKTTGISTYTPEETKLAIECGAWDVIQVPFNMMDQRQAELFSLAEEKGIGIVIRSVLLKGLLSNRGKDLHPALQKVETHIGTLNGLAQEMQLDLPTLATRFALSFRNIAAILVGIDKLAYLNKSLEAANGEYLDAGTFKKAKAMAYPEPDFLNLHQWNVNGWLI